MAKKHIPKLLVVFDTNVLYTQVASDLVRNDVQHLISENSTHPDLKISWHLPEVVLGERKYQMLEEAKKLLPNMQKLEKLLGHGFGIGEDTLKLHVDEAIEKSINQFKFQTTGLDTAAVDWRNLIARSVGREPPFEPSEKEKGFRDSIIAHSFAQLHKSSPSTPRVCLLALVSEDKRLRDYASELVDGANNVRILKSLNELESLINTLVSTIPEEFAIELAGKAAKLFFEKENKKTFYYKESIGEKIREQYAEELSNTIMPDHLRSNGTWWISNPIFIRKERQRIHWISPIEPEFEIYHYESDERTEKLFEGLGGIWGSQMPSKGEVVNKPSPSPTPKTPGGILGFGLNQKKIVDLKGRDKFEVHWSANLSSAQNLTSPHLEKIQYVGNNLEEGSS